LYDAQESPAQILTTRNAVAHQQGQGVHHCVDPQAVRRGRKQDPGGGIDAVVRPWVLELLAGYAQGIDQLALPRHCGMSICAQRKKRILIQILKEVNASLESLSDIRYNKFFMAPNILELYILSHYMHTSTYGPDFERF